MDNSISVFVHQEPNENRLGVWTLPSTYLGLSLGIRQNSVSVWVGIEEKFRRRLAAWKRQYISRALMVWKGADSSCFTVKAYFRLLEGASPHSVPSKMLWDPYVPSKIGF